MIDIMAANKNPDRDQRQRSPNSLNNQQAAKTAIELMHLQRYKAEAAKKKLAKSLQTTCP
jgi:hypothetical protein